MSTDDADELFHRAIKLTGSPDARFLELARTLAALKKADEQRYLDYLGTLKKGRRRAYYLLQIEQAFAGLAVTDADLQEVGWTKLLRLAPVVNKANVQELITKAKSITNRALSAELNGDGKTSPHAMIFFLATGERKLLTKHLRRHGATRSGHGLQNKEKALASLLHHYEQLLATSNAKTSLTVSSQEPTKP